ncbi:hypothetical protein [Mycobacterium aquaticum]|uniref:Uncharacterized protein n=1 Tax=Mycobacterium aquaticum TaxID=1927124 RepID=A0A1X0A6S6_9MYCO|nr:hypothetical protein [Mycobacterium aquaticum]ORA25743.1 hypothetical protein BST13_32715 [Mycobacterium aquaticum]
MSGLEDHPAVTVAAGAAATAVGGVVAVYRGAERLPVLGGLLKQVREDLSARGERVITAGIEPVKAVVTAVAVQVVDMVLDELDLNELVRQRVDLVGLANEVVDGIDLPTIIRKSTDSVTAEVMTDVRSQGERADDMVSGFVDRLLGRDRDQS